jgi:hypothetical protein
MFKGEGTYRQRYLIVAEAMLIRWIASKASGQRRIDAREVAFLALTQLTVKSTASFSTNAYGNTTCY